MFSLEDKRAIMQRKHIYNCSYYGKCNPSAHIVIEVDVERGPIVKEGVPWPKKKLLKFMRRTTRKTKPLDDPEQVWWLSQTMEIWKYVACDWNLRNLGWDQNEICNS